MKRSSESQNLLEQYRASLSPRGELRERVWDELAPRAAAGEPPSLSASPAPPDLPVAPAGLGWSPALVAGALGASALLITAAWSWRAHEPPAQSGREAPRAKAAAIDPPRAAPPHGPPRAELPHSAPAVAADPVQAGADSARDAGAPEVAPRARASAHSAEPLPAGGRRGRARTAVRSAPVQVTPAAAEADDFAPPREAPYGFGLRVPARGASPGRPAPELEEELRLLRSAYEALRSQRPQRALNWLGEHAARFPHGALAEARDVARIMALCEAGQRDAAHAEAAHFLEQSPRSPHAARVRSLCAGTGERP